ncbi:MAG: hypothetical protein IPP00_08300 [Actinomycetales bacterium]|uniref:Uncharacterized protein n=1 Tax=Candidatus Phosphoribacter hodrii TaxID=2953743 RepID=A0A9D7XUM1_9MICO|nr:hypothetical protein [Candidatus Phosphoribacter hodrii]
MTTPDSIYADADYVGQGRADPAAVGSLGAPKTATRSSRTTCSPETSIDGGASAEEAAMRIIDLDSDEDLED